MSLAGENVNMTQLVATPVADPTLTSTSASQGGERTLTGIPITLLWLPYVGFSAFLIALMGLSFLQYHRKHGHKYHNANDELMDCTGENNVTREQSRSVSVDKVTIHETRDSSNRYEDIKKVTETTYRSDKRSRHSADRDPPNGGVHLTQSRKPKPYRTIDEHEPAYEKLLKRNDSQQSGSSRQASGYPKSSSSRPRGPANKTTCDEPSTSSSTVSSKNSSNTSKTNNRSRPPRNRQRRSINYESNQNGSMVDVRIDVDESVATFTPVKPKPQIKEKPTAASRQVNTPTATEQRMGLFCAPPETITPTEKHHQGPTPTITDRIYRGNYVASRSTSPQSLKQTSNQRGYSNVHAQSRSRLTDDETGNNVTSERTAAPVPIWSTMPLRSKPSAPHKDHYTYPFTPSGNMQMLSDTEDDEVFLLKHTKL